MLFAKIKEKLLNRRNDIEISEITDASGTPLDVDEMVAWLNEMKDKISIDESGNINVSTLLSSTISTSNLLLPNLASIRNEDDEFSLFPFVDNAGKVLVVNDDEDGIDAVSLSSGGTQLYLHSCKFGDGGDEVDCKIISTQSATPTTIPQIIVFVENAVSFKVMTNQTEHYVEACFDTESTDAFISYLSPTTAGGIGRIIVSDYSEMLSLIDDTVTPL